jgi:DMSO/TMAO reductase YedYZ molybdopterin-dependent catalytic subunit
MTRAGTVTRNRGKKPSSLRYYQDGPPSHVDMETWRLEVSGIGVDRVSLSWDDLAAMPQVEHDRRMVCVCNWSIRHAWTGVLLEHVLREAGLTETDGLYLRQQSIGTPEKGTYDSTIPLAAALDRQALLCHSIAGEPLPLERGFPLRLIDFGLYGYKGVKGLASLEVTDRCELGVWERKAGYSKDGTIRPKRYWIVDRVEHRFCEEPGEITEF